MSDTIFMNVHKKVKVSLLCRSGAACMVVLTCFVMCGCVQAWVLQCVGMCMCGFAMYGCFGNMCIYIYCVLYCLYCVFCIVSFIYIYSYLYCTSVRTTAT